MKHINIPIFVPHAGCPHDCVFCNQKKITGKDSFDISLVEREIEAALSTVDFSNSYVEIAFFGGSFTGIDRKLMLSLLEISDKFVNIGKVSGVRCSTRPDYIDNEILSILKEHHVKTIEIGVQSMNDRVLELSERGHSAADTERACRLIVESGFELVGQMMTGLPSSTLEDELETARKICALGASAARIYPTVVFWDTALYTLQISGKYIPLSIDEAVKRSADIIDIFVSAGVDILRVGLCENEGLHLDKGIYSGAFHPALGEMCFSEYYFKKIVGTLSSVEIPDNSIVEIYSDPSSLSKAVGYKRMNINRLRKLYPGRKFRFHTDKELMRYEIEISFTELSANKYNPHT